MAIYIYIYILDKWKKVHLHMIYADLPIKQPVIFQASYVNESGGVNPIVDVGEPTTLQHHGFFSASAEIRRLAWRGRGGPWHPPWVTESPMRGVSIAGHDP